MPVKDSQDFKFYQSIDNFLKFIEHQEGYYNQFINYNDASGRKALSLMKEHRMVYFKTVDMHPDYTVEITPIGKEVLRLGGAKKFIDHRKVIEFQSEQLQFEKLKYDVRNSKRIFKTYWWTFGIALAGLLLAIFNFIKSFLY